MKAIPQNKRPLAFIGWIIAVLVIISAAFFAIRTEGFGYFVTPTPTLTPTRTVLRYGSDALATETATPFQPLPTDTPTPTATFTPTPTNTPTATATATNTPVPTNTPIPLPTLTPVDGLPAEYRISGVTGYNQSYNLSCESRSAADWAAYFGYSISESTILASLPGSDNPDAGFVGNVNGAHGQIPPYDYGVHAAPVAVVLNNNGVSANAVKGLSLTDMRKQIASGNPVIAWVVGNVWTGSGVSYTSADGNTTLVAYYEHTVIVTGYDSEGYYFVDGSSSYYRSSSVFASSFAALGNMAITR